MPLKFLKLNDNTGRSHGPSKRETFYVCKLKIATIRARAFSPSNPLLCFKVVKTLTTLVPLPGILVSCSAPLILILQI
jgi:hypothetical protein